MRLNDALTATQDRTATTRETTTLSQRDLHNRRGRLKNSKRITLRREIRAPGILAIRVRPVPSPKTDRNRRGVSKPHPSRRKDLNELQLRDENCHPQNDGGAGKSDERCGLKQNSWWSRARAERGAEESGGFSARGFNRGATATLGRWISSSKRSDASPSRGL